MAFKEVPDIKNKKKESSGTAPIKEEKFFSKEIELNFGKALNDKKRKDLYFEINTLLNAGVDLKRTLEVIVEQTKKKKQKAIVAKILDNVVQGDSLSVAVNKTGEFSYFEVNSISIGEETGRLGTVLKHLGEYYERRMKLKRKMVSIFTYPAFILLVTFAVLYFMLGTVVPMFIDIFKQFDAELPGLTKTIINLSGWMPLITYLFLGLIAAIVITHYTQKDKEQYRAITAQLLLGLPLFGKLFKKVYLARFCQSMQLLTSSKVPLVRALQMSKEMVQFYPIEKACDEMIEGIKQGRSLHELMKENNKTFNTKMVFMVQIGEEVNALDEVFEKLSTQYDEEIEHSSGVIGTVLEPLMIIVIGAIVALILVAMYIPLFNLSNVISG